MDSLDLAFAGIARQAGLVRSRELSPVELVETCLARTEELDPALNAFRTVFAERALAEARQAEGRAGAGEERPLLGVPVAIKDDVDVAGEVTACGSAAHGGPAAADAEVVRRLRAAGAIVLGKTNVPELTIWPFTETMAFGATRNPWRVDRTPGGSSGGSAAAVAAGLVGSALGSDGAGSIRIPAACCHLFGLKPTRGRIPHPLGWHGLSVVGPLARRVADAALFLHVAADGIGSEPPLPPGRLRVAMSKAAPRGAIAELHPEMERAWRQAGELLRSLGHEVVERDPDYGHSMVDVVARFLRGIHDDARHFPHPERFERRTRGMVRLGGAIHPRAMAALAERQAALAARVNEVFDHADVLLTPALAWLPPEVGRWQGRGALRTLAGRGGAAAFTPWTAPWNGTGNPAATVPAGLTEDGIPLSFQLVGRMGDEPTLLSLGAQIEEATGFSERRPPLAAAEAVPSAGR
ncbi:MAG: amidase [Thermoleophilaceae bacterium]